MENNQKKVAIVSCYFQPNYGSMLQALATQEILNIMNIPNETIMIDGLQKEIHDAKIQYFRSRIFSLDVIKDKLGFVRLAIAIKLNKELGHNIAVRKKCFLDFSKKYFITSERFSSKAELGRCANEYAAFLVGSDQLWLPSNIAADYYTLSYVPEKVRKIAYATSFGVSSLPQKQAEQAKRFLPRFDYLSVREKTGQKLIKDLTKLEAELVCDPTLLLKREQWDTLLKADVRIKEPYVFCYFLGNNEISRIYAKKLAQKTGCKIVALQHLDMYIKKDNDFADIAPYDVNPTGFVNLIRNARYVCTDSFHGTVFSIINHKQFFTFRRFTKKTTMSTNSRIDSLLDVLNLRDRIIGTPNDFSNAVRKPIQYNEIDQKLDDFRSKSLDFLKKALEGLEIL